MNGNIREFAQQAGLISSFNSAPHRPDIEKFTELILRHLLQEFEQSMTGQEDDVDYGLHLAIDIIKEQFGVEK